MMMTSKQPNPALNAATMAWLVLMAATGIGWWFGHTAHSVQGGLPLATAGVIVTAFIKVWIVGFQFMELKGAPRALRHAFDAWAVGVCVVLTAICLY